MDPRLNPNLTPRPQNVMQDVVHPSPPAMPPRPVQTPPVSQPTAHTPQPAPQPTVQTPTTATNPIAVADPMPTQIVGAIPLKVPEGASQSTGGTAQPNAKPEHQDDLDRILQAVNNRVKAPNQPPQPQSKKKELGKKAVAKAGKIKDKVGGPKPVGPIAVVLIVALMLSATAIFAYRQGKVATTKNSGPSTVGTSYTAGSAIQDAGGALVHPADLDDYASTLQTKLNSLNDNQDFSSDSLSDHTLGL